MDRNGKGQPKLTNPENTSYLDHTIGRYMSQRKLAKILREEFPLMDVSFLNKCLRPERSGGQLTDRAKEIIGMARNSRIRHERPGTKRITFRAGQSQIDALQQAQNWFGVHTEQMIISKAVDTALDAWGFYSGGKKCSEN